MRGQSVLVAALAILSIQSSGASLDPLVGARVSVASMQSILAAPPLPNFEKSDMTTVTFQEGYVTGQLLNLESSQLYYGNLYGSSTGVGFTSPSFGAFSAFAMVATSKLTGTIYGLSSDHTQEWWLRNLTTTTTAFTAGLAVRLIGDNTSPFAAGIFVGPTFMNMASRFHFDVPSISFLSKDYVSEPHSQGVTVGAIVKLRVHNVMVMPYGLSLIETTDKCKSFTTPNSGDVWPACNGDDRKASLPVSFNAVGVNVGYRDFQTNVYLKVNRDSSLANTRVVQYQLSYALGLKF